jgi:hypothetical protein
VEAAALLATTINDFAHDPASMVGVDDRHRDPVQLPRSVVGMVPSARSKGIAPRVEVSSASVVTLPAVGLGPRLAAQDAATRMGRIDDRA